MFVIPTVARASRVVAAAVRPVWSVCARRRWAINVWTASRPGSGPPKTGAAGCPTVTGPQATWRATGRRAVQPAAGQAGRPAMRTPYLTYLLIGLNVAAYVATVVAVAQPRQQSAERAVLRLGAGPRRGGPRAVDSTGRLGVSPLRPAALVDEHVVPLCVRPIRRGVAGTSTLRRAVPGLAARRFRCGDDLQPQRRDRGRVRCDLRPVRDSSGDPVAAAPERGYGVGHHRGEPDLQFLHSRHRDLGVCRRLDRGRGGGRGMLYGPQLVGTVAEPPYPAR